MRAIIFLMVVTLLSACSTTSPEVAMQQDVDQATAIIQRFQVIPEKGIPPSVHKGWVSWERQGWYWSRCLTAG